MWQRSPRRPTRPATGGGAMRGKLIVAMSVLALVGAACTGSSATGTQSEAPGGPATAPSETLLLGTGSGPILVEVPAGAVLFEQAGSVASLGGHWLLSAEDSEGSTLLSTRDAATGNVVGTTQVPGELDVRVVSESGRAVALMDPLPKGWDPFVPLPRATTRIVVADPTGAAEPRTFDLVGNYEPEAFAAADDALFLIQHLPAETPQAYRVTMLDLDLGRVRPVFGPFKGPAERMPGIRLQQVLPPTANQLYTLYSSARPGYLPHDGSGTDGRVVSFVHVLSLRDGWAHCAGLPESMWDRPSAEQAMAAAPDGTALYVVDAGRGEVAILDTASLEMRTAEVDLGPSGAIERTTAQMSADGRTLFVATAGPEGSSVTAIDVGTFEVLDRWSVQGRISSLGLSGDGARLYAATGDGLVVLDAANGREMAAVPVDAPDAVTQVLAIAS